MLEIAQALSLVSSNPPLQLLVFQERRYDTTIRTANTSLGFALGSNCVFLGVLQRCENSKINLGQVCSFFYPA